MKYFTLLLLASLALDLSAAENASPPAAPAAPAASAAGTTKADAPVYQCPMHPWIRSDHPGKCTICGMNLVVATAAAKAAPEGVVTLMPSIITTIGVETSTVVRQPLTRTMRVNGRIDDDDTRHRILSARVPGRIERLDITYPGQQVAAGAPLATIYSPEIYSAERVYVERIKAGEGAFPVAERAAARERLLELGLTDSDLATLEKNLQPSAIVAVRAPVTGTVVSKYVYEGQYVQTSDRLFAIADFSSMWFVFDIYEQDFPWVHVGQTVEITTRSVPGEVLLAPIAFIDPNFDEQTRATKGRAILSNPHPATMSGVPHPLPHRVLAEGRVLVESPAVLAAPRSAILDAGGGPVAYVDLGNGDFEQRRLGIGRRGDALVEILAGLSEGEKVVTTGALLIDAQAQLTREASGRRRSSVGPVAVGQRSEAAPRQSETGATALNSQPSTLNPGLIALASIVIDATAALAADDFAKYQKTFPSLKTAGAAYPRLPELQLGTDLKSARQSFEPWSTAAADLLKPYRAQLGLKIFQCPMTPILGKGRWIQRSQPLKNPFFGSAMADCGEELP